MTMSTNINTTDSDPDFCIPSSSSAPSTPHNHQPPRKKQRTKLINIGPKPKKCYAKKPDPSAPKITRPCSECGKKFWSWKALFGHMRCHPERQWRGINPPPNYCRPISPIHQQTSSDVETVITAEDHKVASCLLMLANSNNSIDDGAAILVGDHEEVNCTRFQCSSSKKSFGTQQPPGGHKASHKNVKGCFAITRSNDGDEYGVIHDHDHSRIGDVKENVEEYNNDNSNNKMVMFLGHKCRICLRVFSSGQALVWHKRCHCKKGKEALSSTSQQGLNFLPAKDHGTCGLDLNLPAPVEDDYSPGLTLDLRLGL